MKKSHSKYKLTAVIALLVVSAVILAGKMLDDTPIRQQLPNEFLAGPPTAQNLTVQLLEQPTRGGNIRFTATYDPALVGDTKQFSIFVNDPRTSVKKQIVLHDDGEGGDEKAGDFVFTAILNEDMKLFKAAMARAETELRQAGGQIIEFNGRAATVRKRDKLFDMDAFARFEKVPIDRNIFDIAPSKGKAARSGETEETGMGATVTQQQSGGAIEEAALPPCNPVIDRFKSLFITDISVTEDPVRTFNPCSGVGNPNGAWTFKTLMANMANQPVTGNSVDKFTQEWLDTWMKGTPRLTPGTTNPVVNTQVLDSRVHPVTPLTTQASSIMHTVIRPWLRAAAASPGLVIDSLTTSSNYWKTVWNRLVLRGFDVMKFAPFKFTAVVNRIDLSTIVASGGGYGGTTSTVTNGGEGRFVFSIIKDPASNCSTAVSSLTQPFVGFNVIFEYGIPIFDCAGLLNFQNMWRDLSDLPFGANFNELLEKITNVFTAANANPKAKNGSALNQLRTNEIANSSLIGGGPFWQLREFVLTGNLLQNTTTKLEPMAKFNGASLPPITTGNTVADISTLAGFINSNTAAIQANNYTVPLTVAANGTPGTAVNFLAGRADLRSPSAISTNHHWNGSGSSGATTFVTDDSARFMFSLNTCTGCHGGETQTVFTHVRYIGFGHNITPTSLSGGLRDISSFLTGLGTDAVGTDNDNDPNGLFFVSDAAGRPTGAPRIRGFNDLLRREMFMKNLLCNGCSGSGVIFAIVDAVGVAQVARTH
jgi:hypothetical protein